MSGAVPPAGSRRILRVGPIELDETHQELTVGGQRRPIEAKPLAVLQALLLHAGTRLGKRDLIEIVWGNADHISEASLTTAISKLRAALGEAGRDLIDVVPGSGYRIAAKVEVSANRGPELALALRTGDPVPGRPQWRLHALLGNPALNDVWLAVHEKTQEWRVFKFADSDARLDTLRREAAISRVLHAALGPREDLIRVLEWNFTDRPCFMESPYGGLSLPGWAAAQGGLAATTLPDRLEMVARIARTLAAAHAAGVLHGDIKPANILVETLPDAPPRLRLADFGAGGLNDPARRAGMSITLDGLADGASGRTSGTLRYMAPEVLAGGPPTTAADLYALGVLLFQLAVADLDRPLTLGWEADIDDPFLTEDLLGRGNPANSGTADETLMGAAEAAEASIDRRLAGDPMVAGAIYLALARAFDSRSTYAAARSAYQRAIAAFDAAGREGLADAVIARLNLASMEMTSGAPGALATARRLLARTAPQIARLGPRRREAEVWLDEARATQQMFGGDVRAAQADYASAADLAQSMPTVLDPGTRLALRQREAFTYIRLGDFAAAERLFTQLLRERLALNGPRHPDTLDTELHLAQIQIAQGRAADALPGLDRIYPDFVAVFGPTHLRTLLLLATRGQALQQLGRYDDALRDQTTVYQTASAMLGRNSYVAVGGLADAAVTRCRAGQAADGAAMARAALSASSPTFGTRAALTQVIQADLAFCLIQLGQDAAALPLLDGIDTNSVAALTMDPQYDAETSLMRAAALLGLGRAPQAAPILARIGPVLARPGADPYLQRWAARLARDGTSRSR